MKVLDSEKESCTRRGENKRRSGSVQTSTPSQHTKEAKYELTWLF